MWQLRNLIIIKLPTNLRWFYSAPHADDGSDTRASGCRTPEQRLPSPPGRALVQLRFAMVSKSQSGDSLMSSISLYSELLANIGQVTVFASFASTRDHIVHFELSPDGGAISCGHPGGRVTIPLPCAVIKPTVLNTVASGTYDAYVRLQVAKSLDLDVGGGQRLMDSIPWMAGSLTSNTQIACKACKTVVINERIADWRNLPSEHWADLMDLWHCHKPEGAGQSSLSASQRYMAVERTRAKSGTGLVDSSHILLSAADCTNLEVCSVCVVPILCQVSHFYNIPQDD